MLVYGIRVAQQSIFFFFEYAYLLESSRGSFSPFFLASPQKDAGERASLFFFFSVSSVSSLIAVSGGLSTARNSLLIVIITVDFHAMVVSVLFFFFLSLPLFLPLFFFFFLTPCVRDLRKVRENARTALPFRLFSLPFQGRSLVNITYSYAFTQLYASIYT